MWIFESWCRRVFAYSSPSARTWKDVLEQLVAYTLSPEYEEMKALIALILGEEGKKEATIEERAA